VRISIRSPRLLYGPVNLFWCPGGIGAYREQAIRGDQMSSEIVVPDEVWVSFTGELIDPADY
jgi:hypothetical protein